MPELQNTFQAGKMNKDADERIIPGGEYRDALNIEITTSEDSNIGTAQTILGNRQVTSILSSNETHHTVGHVVDEKKDRIFRLVATPAEENDGIGIDRILEYNTDISIVQTEIPVFTDVYRSQSTTSGSFTIDNANDSLFITSNGDYIRPGMQVKVEDVTGSAIVGWSYADEIYISSVYYTSDNVCNIKLSHPNNEVFSPAISITGTETVYFKAPRVLKFDMPDVGYIGVPEKVSITGINLIDDLLFWTDNYSEPKKIHIPRSKEGTKGDVSNDSAFITGGSIIRPSHKTHTRLIVKNVGKTTGLEDIDFITEDHITVIRKGPTHPPVLETWNTSHVDLADETPDVINCTTNILFADYINGSNVPWTPSATNTFLFKENGVNLTDWNTTTKNKIKFTYGYTAPGSGEWVVAEVFAVITADSSSFLAPSVAVTSAAGEYEAIITSMTPNQPMSPENPTFANFFVYEVELLQNNPMWEFKFPKFAYRYKYSDGEYSCFGPFTQVAFVPSVFDYAPKKGYNLGMVNQLRYLEINDWVPKDIPKDVIQVDIVYKETSSPNVYTIESFKPDDVPPVGAAFNPWNTIGPTVNTTASFNHQHKGSYLVKTDLIHKTIPANQLLRPWDNVPRVSMAQEMSGNRLIYANYIQNYDLHDVSGKDIGNPEFSVAFVDTNVTSPPGSPGKSLKSMRNYQIGVVYRDEHGRETPVLTSQSGAKRLPKTYASKYNRISVSIDTLPPAWATSFKFFIKETSNEYYNLAMDRYYTAKDGNIWLSFPSSERNKVSEESFIILKKQHDSHIDVSEDDARYKIIAIENNAPDFIKTENLPWGSISPYPSFTDSGAPYPGRQDIDIDLKQWNASALGNLDAVNTTGIQVQVRTPQNFYQSLWYDVTNVGNVDLGADEVKRLTCKTVFGEDMAFTSNDGGTTMIENLVLEVRQKKVVNRAQFDGRFFVKIFKDAVLTENLITTQNHNIDNLIPALSKRISYMDYCSSGWRNADMYDGWAGYGLGTHNHGNHLSDPAVSNSFTRNAIVPWNDPKNENNTWYRGDTNFAQCYCVPVKDLDLNSDAAGTLPDAPNFWSAVLTYRRIPQDHNHSEHTLGSASRAISRHFADRYFKDNRHYKSHQDTNLPKDKDGNDVTYLAQQPLVVPRGSRWNTQSLENSPGPFEGRWTDERPTINGITIGSTTPRSANSGFGPTTSQVQIGPRKYRNYVNYGVAGDPVAVGDQRATGTVGVTYEELFYPADTTWYWKPGLKTNGPWGGNGSSYVRGTRHPEQKIDWKSNIFGSQPTWATHNISPAVNPVGGMLAKYHHGDQNHFFHGDAGVIYTSSVGSSSPAKTDINDSTYGDDAINISNDKWLFDRDYTKAHTFMLPYSWNTYIVHAKIGLGTYSGLKTNGNGNHAGNRSWNSPRNYIKDLDGNIAFHEKYGDQILGGTGFWGQNELRHQWVHASNPQDTNTYSWPYSGINQSWIANGNEMYMQDLYASVTGCIEIASMYGVQNYPLSAGNGIIGWRGEFFRTFATAAKPTKVHLLQHWPQEKGTLAQPNYNPFHNVWTGGKELAGGGCGVFGPSGGGTMNVTVGGIYDAGSFTPPYSTSTTISPSYGWPKGGWDPNWVTGTTPQTQAGIGQGSDYSSYVDELEVPTNSGWWRPMGARYSIAAWQLYFSGGHALPEPNYEVPFVFDESQYPLSSPRKSNAHPNKGWWTEWWEADNDFTTLLKVSRLNPYGELLNPREDPARRWIIDRVGASQDKSGAGIWRDRITGNQMIDISFIGIGNGRRGNKVWDLTETPSELGFADALNTPGTRFRFKEDHNQTVYTIVNSYLSTDGEPSYIDKDSGESVEAPAQWNENPEILNFENDPNHIDYDLPLNRRIRWRLQLDKPIGTSANAEPPYYHPINNALDPNLVDARGDHLTNPGYNPFGRTTGAIGECYARVTATSDGVHTDSNIIQFTAVATYLIPGLTLVSYNPGSAQTCHAVDPLDVTVQNPTPSPVLLREDMGITVLSVTHVDAQGDPEFLTAEDEANGMINPSWSGTNTNTIVELSAAVTTTATVQLTFARASKDIKCYEFPFAGVPPNGSDASGHVNAAIYNPTMDEEYNGSTARNGSAVSGGIVPWVPSGGLPTGNVGRMYWDTCFQTYTTNNKENRAMWNETAGIAATGSTLGNGNFDATGYDTVTNTYSNANPGVSGLNEWGLNYQTIEILRTFDTGSNESDLPMSANPAIWETEPREDIGIDIYYEASEAYPINLEEDSSESQIRVGMSVLMAGTEFKVGSIAGNVITLAHKTTGVAVSLAGSYPVGQLVTIIDRNFSNFGVGGNIYKQIHSLGVAAAGGDTTLTLNKNVHGNQRDLKYFNCYSFRNGVESNRIRDDYNAVTIDKGVKASMPMATPYEEERRSSGLIFSGIYNSTSGINRTNQFIQAEPITKDLNPVYGEIKKIYSRNTDLIAFCEDKVFKILANKDALFEAGGNQQLTANNRVLGQTIPFTGEWGMSHRESFAAESYRVYFTDANRGAVVRLSRDGMTPISDHGMKDYFFDNLKDYTKQIGSFDDRKGTYNLSLQQSWDKPDVTISFTEDTRGWVSFKSFIPERGCGFNNTYFTFSNGQIWRHHDETKYYATGASREFAPSTAPGDDHIIELVVIPNGLTIGMNVLGKGLKDCTVITDIDPSDTSITISNSACVPINTPLTFTSARNNFYNNQYDSSITTIFNGGPEVVKAFSSLVYEGSQARIIENTPTTADELTSGVSYESSDGTLQFGFSGVGQYYNNIAKCGWYVNKIRTDLQEGSVLEFKDKEGKWFNYIRGSIRDFDTYCATQRLGEPLAGYPWEWNELTCGVIANDLNTKEFSLQGIDYADCWHEQGWGYIGDDNNPACGEPTNAWSVTPFDAEDGLEYLNVSLVDDVGEFYGNATPTQGFSVYPENCETCFYVPYTTIEQHQNNIANGTITGGPTRVFILNPAPGYYVSAEECQVQDGDQIYGGGAGDPWVDNKNGGSMAFGWQGGIYIKSITFTDSTVPWTPSNNVIITVEFGDLLEVTSPPPNPGEYDIFPKILVSSTNNPQTSNLNLWIL